MSVKVKTNDFEIVAPTADDAIKIINSLKDDHIIEVEQIVCPDCECPSSEETERPGIMRCTQCGCEYT